MTRAVPDNDIGANGQEPPHGLAAGLRGVVESTSEETRFAAARARTLLRDLVRDPAHRAFRWVLAVGLAVRLLLAPLTAWGVDTTYFALTDLNLYYTGNPYRANTFYNPPLGPVTQLPGLATLTQFGHLSQLVSYVPGLLEPSTLTGMYAPYLPSPAFLLVLKLPLILADAATAVLLYRLLGAAVGRRFAGVGAAAWFLNPLVIWASSVHGEVDALAVLAIVGFLYCWQRGSAFGAGVALGLGTMAKLYPLLLLPLAVVLFGRSVAGRGAARRWVLLGAGFAVAILPFLPLLQGAAPIVAHQAGNNEYGGISLLILLNPGFVAGAASVPASVGPVAVGLYELALGAAVAASVFAVLRAPSRYAASASGSLARVSLLLAALVSGALLAVVSPQAENLVDLLPPVLLAVPMLRTRSALALAGGLGAIGWGQYLSLLGPLAFFYPLATLLGGPATAFVNRSVISYGGSVGLYSQVTFWVIFGVVGGAFVLALWAWSTIWALRTPAERVDPVWTAVDPAARPGARSRLRARWAAAGAARRGGSRSAATVVALAALVASGAMAGFATSRTERPLFEASVVAFGYESGGAAAQVRVQVGDFPMQARLGLVPAERAPTGPVYFFLDPTYPTPYATYTEAYGVAERVSLALGSDPGADPVQFIDAGQLPGVLQTSGPATLVVVGGLLPDFVLHGQASPLERWIAGGGTLVWAGGPLGYAEGHPYGNGQFSWDPLLWEGQLDLVGFPLTDPGSEGPISSSQPSPIASALGLQFNGTPSGANTTLVSEYGGTVLGWVGPGGAPGESPRASLVRIPVGAGRILFFGGAFAAATHPQQYVPLADFTLSADLIVLLATNVDPAGSGANSVQLELSPGASEVVDVSGQFTSGALLLLSDPTSPMYFGDFAAFLPDPAAGAVQKAAIPLEPVPMAPPGSGEASLPG